MRARVDVNLSSSRSSSASSGAAEVLAAETRGTRHSRSAQRRLTRSAAPDSPPAWSPDGRRIAFAGCGAIYVMNADGSGQRQPDAQRGCRLRSNLVARRADDRLPEQARPQLGDLRNSRRRGRAAEPDAQPVGRNRVCLVARAEAVTRNPEVPRPRCGVDCPRVLRPPVMSALHPGCGD